LQLKGDPGSTRGRRKDTEMKMDVERKIRRFDEKYRDKGGFSMFQDMIDNLSTLEEIGDHFGFSRQNAAGLFQSFFSEGYNRVQRKRKSTRETKRQKRATDLDLRFKEYVKTNKERSARKIHYTKVVKERAEELGLPVELVANRNSAIKILVNDYSVNISGTDTETIYHIPKKRHPSIYYRFAITSKPVDFCIFVLDLGNNDFTFYIIPFEEIKHLTLITLKDQYSDYRRNASGKRPPSKYSKYRNTWALLTGPKNKARA